MVQSIIFVAIHHVLLNVGTWSEAYDLASAAVAQMTTDEKLNMTIGRGEFINRCSGNTGSVESLGIPEICLNDGPAGVRATTGVTGFPSGINVASTFSRRLMRARGEAIAEEFRNKGVHVMLGPAMDLMRNPQAGRAWESFGPDPYLSGEGAYETVVGVQSVGVQACAKHFAAYNQEHWRYVMSVEVDDRTMHEMYLYPYLRAIEANVSAVMCAYPEVNETHACENSALIGESGLLRQSGFQGYVVSDWGATHGTAADNANAGLDMEQPGSWEVIGGGVFRLGLRLAVLLGTVSEDRFDQMVTRILAPWYLLGQGSDYPATNFDVQPWGGSLNENVTVRSANHTAVTREIGAASAVLLKNSRSVDADGNTLRGLPLSTDNMKTLAIVGLDAQEKVACGQYNGCDDGTMAIGWGSGSNYVVFTVDPFDALTDYYGSSTDIITSSANDVSLGASTAAGVDVAIVFANAMSGELVTEVDGNFGDRNDMELWFDTSSLVESVAAVCNNTIVVIHSVGPVNMTWSDLENVTAIIYAGAPGEQTGPSLVDVLSGSVNPSGRLPFSIAYDSNDYGTSIVTYANIVIPNVNYTERLLLDYRYMDAHNITPRYEFGFGLSYTTFNYSDMSISNENGEQVITFTVSNTGDIDGTEIPQLYLAYPDDAGEPPVVLRGFDEVPLSSGQSASVVMTLSERDISIWDTVSQTWTIPSGTFTVYVGASVKDIRLTDTFVIS
ncbi:glycoside hydrolase family 3 protein [Fistulina hepatica ATCC 64428]|uniref:beta-glucosidase n=1 Tax=Fistulina hepatica ATCC 64428 TaxID=1128425 RepID=A0A0D7A0G3_9AGAR|nr:glycoside hydrolase family 3 protein [Fistulina hepatica ATCC 64428]